MLHDVDDATLMQALRDADPLHGSTLDDGARERLEQSWREAMADPADPADRSRWRRVIAVRGRTLQPVAAGIMAVIVLGSGVLVSNTLARRGAVEPGAGGVEGSFRAVQYLDGQPMATFLVAGGRALIQPADTTLGSAIQPWRGFSEGPSMRIDPQVRYDGDQLYVRISTDDGPLRWYRHRGPLAQWPPGLATTPPPVFDEGTRGFARVDDEDAAAEGLRRYTADVAAADLGFLGWFSPMNQMIGLSDTVVDVWVDADGRVRRLQGRTGPDDGLTSSTRFDRFDAVAPIDMPYPDGADAPVAEDVAGMILYAYGDPSLAGELRERVTAELERDADIAEFDIFERSAADRRTNGPTIEGELFVVAVRFTDDIETDTDVQLTKLDRFSRLTVGDLPANAEDVFRLYDVFPDTQGLAAIYAPGLVHSMLLDG